MRDAVLNTPDGRYILVRGRLWRAANPNLRESVRKALVAELMDARRAIKTADKGSPEMRAARKRVDAAKVALGERGAPWWNDGTPDLNRRLVKNTPYRDWSASIEANEK
jgi:hypothetical protein